MPDEKDIAPPEELEVEIPPKFFRMDRNKRDEVLALDPEQLGVILAASIEVTSGPNWEGAVVGIGFKMIVPNTAIHIPGKKPQGIPHVLLQIEWKKKGVIEVVEGTIPTKLT
ncbi:MAG: hypothetical protein WC479_05485 [Candidatus Izemoplasmatales bacterium]